MTDKKGPRLPPAGRPSKAKTEPGLQRQVVPGLNKVRLNLDIDTDLHTRLKVYAAKRRISISDVVRELIGTLDL
ncbi:MAG: chromosome partitioning protein ParB [Deltaproteobacteria bacterium]|jgi:hypothetical protein|nr:chromosome partitioning protein ParB [Deltaproteobacteria bacterium]